MRNLAAKFGKIFDICKKFSKNLVDERGNIPRVLSISKCNFWCKVSKNVRRSKI